MSRQQREGRNKQDHGTKGTRGNRGSIDLRGKRPMAGYGKTPTNKYWCRRKERTAARLELKRLVIELAIIAEQETSNG